MVQQAKKSLRARMKEHLAGLEAQELRDRSHAAARRLCEMEAFQQASAVMIFLPLPQEIDATPIALRAWQNGKTVAVPLVNFEQRHMIPVEIHSLSEPMDTDSYGLRTPSNAPPVPVEWIDLVVVPGLAFDETGNRVGRGGGFYDRFLAQAEFRGTTCGYGLDEQVVSTVPTHGRDVPLNLLVTDRRTLRFNSRPVNERASRNV